MLELRQATPADAPLVLALTLAAYEEYRGVLFPESGVFAETVAGVRRHLQGDAGHSRATGGGGEPASGAVLALLDGQAVGCARWSVQTDEPEGGLRGAADAPVTRGARAQGGAYLYVGRVAVLPAHRRRGVATALMTWCERLAQRRGLHEVRLGVRLTLPRNEIFYERLGYRRTGELETRAGYGPIARWMAKRVDDPAS